MKPIIVFGTAVLLVSSQVGRPQGLNVDQSWLGKAMIRSSSSIQPIFDPTGQEFTPSFNALNAVEFITQDGISQDGQGAILQVKLHSSDMNGPVIAQSLPQTLPNGYLGTTKFEFPSLVPVVPGNRYFFRVQMLTTAEGGSWTMADDAPIGPAYPGGRWVQAGVASAGRTFIFREGIILDHDVWLTETFDIPEPATWTIAGFVGLGLLFSRCRRQHSAT